VLAAALVMLACSISYAAYSWQFSSVREKDWRPLESKVNDVDRESKRLIADEEAALKKFKETKEHGDHLVNNLEGRKHWLEFLSAINGCLPKDDKPMPSTTDPAELRTIIMHRNQMLVTNLDSQQMEDVGRWFTLVKPWYHPVLDSPGAPPLSDPSSGAVSGGAATPGGNTGAVSSDGPSGPGMIVQLYGRHYHNADDDKEGEGAQYVRNTLIKALASKKMHDLGVSYPVLIKPEPISVHAIPIPSPKRKGSDAGLVGGDASATDEKIVDVHVKRFRFRVQFVWQPKSLADQVAPPAGTANTVSASPATVAPTTPPAAAPKKP